MSIVRRVKITLILLAITLQPSSAINIAWAQQRGPKLTTIQFMGTEVRQLSGTYLVLTDANVRARPATKGKRIGRRAKGDRVRVVGRAKGPWLAIRDNNGRDIGFIYQSTLMPVIDGSLKKNVSGKLMADTKVSCSYKINFTGRSMADGQASGFADYEVHWKCSIDGKLVIFQTPMFLTEGPYRGISKRIHQITIDIPQMTLSLEDVLSTHSLWDRGKKIISFDSVTAEKYRSKSQMVSLEAKDIESALDGAVRLAAAAWSKSLWRVFLEKAEGKVE